MSKKSCPFVYSNSLYINGQYVLYIQHFFNVQPYLSKYNKKVQVTFAKKKLKIVLEYN